ncbi:MAG: pyridoxal phosphate-dependent aminotransferase [Deltaproteobacteria bacterium]|nr:pyridoxal phosphate-dependent aminotransferase [Deltaproteobacteria bacterium]
MKWSERTAWDRTPNATSARAQAARENAIDLSESNPTVLGFAPPADVLDAFADRAAALYAPAPLGLPSARAAIALYYERRGVPCDPARVVLTASTSEAYFLLFTLLADPGDRVLVPAPSYPLFGYLADVAGVVLAPYPLAYDGEWHTDFAALEAAVDARTRAIVVVTPNNPTAHYLKPAEHARVADLCSRSGIALIADEVFADYPIEAAAPSFIAESSALTFVLSGLSKVALLPQAKLGWCAVSGPGPLVGEALARLEVLCDTFLSVSGPVQHALPSLLLHGEALQPVVRARLAENLAALKRTLTGSAATVLRCEGGFTALVRLPNIRDDDAWCEALLSGGVIVQPGHFYDLSSGPFVVLSLLGEPERFLAGVTKLRGCL